MVGAASGVTDSLSTHVSDLQPLRAGLVVGLVCAIWLSSAASPLVFVLALLHGWMSVVVALAAITALAHLPLLRRSSAAASFFRWAFNRAFASVSVRFEPGSAPGSSGAESSGPASTPGGPGKLYAVHPHGIFCMGFIQLVLHPAMREVTFCFSSYLYNSPLFLILGKLVGRPDKASKASMTALMRRGADLSLTPGGFEEATLTSGAGAERVYVKKRAGFLKYCLEHGLSVCPVYAFGEKQLYANAQGCWALRHWLNGFGVPTIFPFGRRCFPLVPRPKPLLVVVGSPLHLAHVPHPTPAQVAAAHGEYIAALTALFERHKAEAYGEEASGLSLELW